VIWNLDEKVMVRTMEVAGAEILLAHGARFFWTPSGGWVLLVVLVQKAEESTWLVVVIDG